MRRVRELIEAARLRYPDDRFFDDFTETCQLNIDKKRYYRSYDDAFQTLDPASWETLKSKALNHYQDHRNGQKKQGFFNQLNEAFAYRYLVKRGCTPVKILKEDGTPTPDIQFGSGNRKEYCEVKTIGLSDEELDRRVSKESYDGTIFQELSTGFFEKFGSAVNAAMDQVRAKGSDGLVFVIWNCDDFSLDHYKDHRKSIIRFCDANGLKNIYVKIGLRFNRRIHITNC